jgi:hypothetical protein
MGEPRLPEPLHEGLVLWPAYTMLATNVSQAHPAEADPRSMYGCIRAIGDRAEAFVYAHNMADTYEGARTIVDDVLMMLQAGRRPRSMRELGMGSAADIVGPKPKEVPDSLND